MMGRVKEEEKNEKIIRGLLKLPANRRCINCNTQGPLYVCTTFWTFVCATCSGIHREFTHRVKSVSMAKFTLEEVTSLQRGGNERAEEVYFKEWDWVRQSVPSNSNIDGLWKFIKHVYVDRRYTGEKNVDGARTPKEVDRKDSFTQRGGLHSLPYLDTHQQRCMEKAGSSGRGDSGESGNNYDERRNLGQCKESQKHADHRRRISAYFEEEDDRIRERISETIKSEANFSNRIEWLDRKPSNRYKALDSSKTREVRSLQEILDRIPSMRASAALKEDGGRPSNTFVQMQRTASNISRSGQDEGNSMEPRRLNSMGHEKKNLGSPGNISFECDPVSQAQQSPKSTSQSIPEQANSPNSLARNDCPSKGNQSKTASNGKNLDSVVATVKAIGGELNAEIHNMHSMPSNRGVSPAAPPSNVLTSSLASSSPTPKASLVSAAFPLNTSEANHAKQEQGILQPPYSRFPNTATQSAPYSKQNSQSHRIPQANSEDVLKPLPSVHTLNGKMEFLEGHGTGPLLHSEPSNQNCSGRKELPQHLFASTHSSAPVLSAGWQPVQAHGMGYDLQYSSPVQLSTVYQPTKSTNNFDSNDGTHLLESPLLSSMDSNRLGSPSTQWMPAQSSAYAAVPLQPSSSTSGMPPFCSYMAHQLPHNLPPAGYQGVEVWGSNPTVFSTLNITQQPTGRFSNSAIQRSFSSVGGNPFA